MRAASSLHFLPVPGTRLLIAAAAASLLVGLALLVLAVALGVTGGSPPVDPNLMAPFRWGPAAPTGLA
jgi:hypothetical protein